MAQSRVLLVKRPEKSSLFWIGIIEFAFGQHIHKITMSALFHLECECDASLHWTNTCNGLELATPPCMQGNILIAQQFQDTQLCNSNTKIIHL